VESLRSVRRALEDQRGAGIANGQAGQPGIQKAIDLELCVVREVRDVLAAHDHRGVDPAVAHQDIDDGKRSEYSRAGIRNVERAGAVEAKSPLQPNRRSRLEGDSARTVEPRDVAANEEVDVAGSKARSRKAVFHGSARKIQREFLRRRLAPRLNSGHPLEIEFERILAAVEDVRRRYGAHREIGSQTFDDDGGRRRACTRRVMSIDCP
jgi:hypothetical protein